VAEDEDGWRRHLAAGLRLRPVGDDESLPRLPRGWRMRSRDTPDVPALIDLTGADETVRAPRRARVSALLETKEST
jgi:hypothetical protein